MLKIGVYGGAFNPPHTGHLTAANRAARWLGLDKVLIVPTNAPPHKMMPQDMPTPGQRLEMARIMARGVKGGEVSDIEVSRGGVSYTADTMDQLAARYPGSGLWLILGSDMFLNIEHWYDPQRIFDVCALAVLSRAAHEGEREIREHFEKISVRYRLSAQVVPHRPVEISSSRLRGMIGAGKGKRFLPPGVFEYILENGLYAGGGGEIIALDKLREQVLEKTPPGRRGHVAACEAEAIKLAMKWGCDVKEARYAAVLHDVTKGLGREDQLKLLGKYGIIADTAELKNEKLLHALTGAAVARELYNMPDSVVQAVRWHTTGRPGMTPLDKIIYLADAIEPTRSYAGVGDIRELAYEDLDKAVIKSLEATLGRLRSASARAHRNTEDALRCLMKGMEDETFREQQK